MTESLRLAFLSSDHPQETARGTGHIIAELGRRFVRTGHEVSVYYPVEDRTPPSPSPWQGVRTVPVRVPSRSHLPFGPNIAYSRSVARQLPLDLDLVVGHNEWGGVWVQRRLRQRRRSSAPRGPIGVQAFHGVALRFLEIGRAGRPPRWRPRLGYYSDRIALRYLEGGAARNATAVLACSRAIAEEVGRLYGVPRERFRVIYNGVEPQSIPTGDERAAARRGLGLGDDVFTIAFIGEDVRRKGLEVAVRTVHALRARGETVVLLNLGNSEPSSDGVQSFGVVDPATKRRLLAAADLFFLPTHYEGLPAVVQEAAALRLPVVTTPDAHVEWGSPGRDFLLLEPNTPEAAVELIRPLIGSPERRRALADGGLRALGGRSYDQQAEEYLAFFRELLSAAPP